MAKFTRFTSADSGSPVLNGSSGSLVTVLDWCLVSGGSQNAIGWLKPLPTSGSCGCWQQPSGSGCVVYVNDACPSTATGGGGAQTREAWAVGWESITSTNLQVGTGTGQFPRPEQSLTLGHVVVRKTTSIDLIAREWLMFADDRTFYLFLKPYDASYTTAYTYFWFGDIFSYCNKPDNYKCMIMGRDAIGVGGGSDYTGLHDYATNPTARGRFIQRPMYGGAGRSQMYNQVGDYGKTVLGSPNSFDGVLGMPNSADQTILIHPIEIIERRVEPDTNFYNLRGRYRGLYHTDHSQGTLSNGQVFSGANEHAGKSFVVIKRSYNGGCLVIETSDTVDTN